MAHYKVINQGIYQRALKKDKQGGNSLSEDACAIKTDNNNDFKCAILVDGSHIDNKIHDNATKETQGYFAAHTLAEKLAGYIVDTNINPSLFSISTKIENTYTNAFEIRAISIDKPNTDYRVALAVVFIHPKTNDLCVDYLGDTQVFGIFQKRIVALSELTDNKVYAGQTSKIRQYNITEFQRIYSDYLGDLHAIIICSDGFLENSLDSGFMYNTNIFHANLLQIHQIFIENITKESKEKALKDFLDQFQSSDDMSVVYVGFSDQKPDSPYYKNLDPRWFSSQPIPNTSNLLFARPRVLLLTSDGINISNKLDNKDQIMSKVQGFYEDIFNPFKDFAPQFKTILTGVLGKRDNFQLSLEDTILSLNPGYAGIIEAKNLLKLKFDVTHLILSPLGLLDANAPLVPTEAFLDTALVDFPEELSRNFVKECFNIVSKSTSDKKYRYLSPYLTPKNLNDTEDSSDIQLGLDVQGFDYIIVAMNPILLKNMLGDVFANREPTTLDKQYLFIVTQRTDTQKNAFADFCKDKNSGLKGQIFSITDNAINGEVVVADQLLAKAVHGLAVGMTDMSSKSTLSRLGHDGIVDNLKHGLRILSIVLTNTTANQDLEGSDGQKAFLTELREVGLKNKLGDEVFAYRVGIAGSVIDAFKKLKNWDNLAKDLAPSEMRNFAGVELQKLPNENDEGVIKLATVFDIMSRDNGEDLLKNFIIANDDLYDYKGSGKGYLVKDNFHSAIRRDSPKYLSVFIGAPKFDAEINNTNVSFLFNTLQQDSDDVFKARIRSLQSDLQSHFFQDDNKKGINDGGKTYHRYTVNMKDLLKDGRTLETSKGVFGKVFAEGIGMSDLENKVRENYLDKVVIPDVEKIYDLKKFAFDVSDMNDAPNTLRDMVGIISANSFVSDVMKKLLNLREQQQSSEGLKQYLLQNKEFTDRNFFKATPDVAMQSGFSIMVTDWALLNFHSEIFRSRAGVPSSQQYADIFIYILKKLSTDDVVSKSFFDNLAGLGIKPTSDEKTKAKENGYFLAKIPIYKLNTYNGKDGEGYEAALRKMKSVFSATQQASTSKPTSDITNKKLTAKQECSQTNEFLSLLDDIEKLYTLYSFGKELGRVGDWLTLTQSDDAFFRERMRYLQKILGFRRTAGSKEKLTDILVNEPEDTCFHFKPNGSKLTAVVETGWGFPLDSLRKAINTKKLNLTNFQDQNIVLQIRVEDPQASQPNAANGNKEYDTAKLDKTSRELLKANFDVIPPMNNVTPNEIFKRQGNYTFQIYFYSLNNYAGGYEVGLEKLKDIFKIWTEEAESTLVSGMSEEILKQRRTLTEDLMKDIEKLYALLGSAKRFSKIETLSDEQKAKVGLVFPKNSPLVNVVGALFGVIEEQGMSSLKGKILNSAEGEYFTTDTSQDSPKVTLNDTYKELSQEVSTKQSPRSGKGISVRFVKGNYDVAEYLELARRLFYFGEEGAYGFSTNDDWFKFVRSGEFVLTLGLHALNSYTPPEEDGTPSYETAIWDLELAFLPEKGNLYRKDYIIGSKLPMGVTDVITRQASEQGAAKDLAYRTRMSEEALKSLWHIFEIQSSIIKLTAPNVTNEDYFGVKCSNDYYGSSLLNEISYFFTPPQRLSQPWTAYITEDVIEKNDIYDKAGEFRNNYFGYLIPAYYLQEPQKDEKFSVKIARKPEEDVWATTTKPMLQKLGIEDTNIDKIRSVKSGYHVYTIPLSVVNKGIVFYNDPLFLESLFGLKSNTNKTNDTKKSDLSDQVIAERRKVLDASLMPNIKKAYALQMLGEKLSDTQGLTVEERAEIGVDSRDNKGFSAFLKDILAQIRKENGDTSKLYDELLYSPEGKYFTFEITEGMPRITINEWFLTVLGWELNALRPSALPTPEPTRLTFVIWKIGYSDENLKKVAQVFKVFKNWVLEGTEAQEHFQKDNKTKIILNLYELNLGTNSAIQKYDETLYQDNIRRLEEILEGDSAQVEDMAIIQKKKEYLKDFLDTEFAPLIERLYTMQILAEKLSDVEDVSQEIQDKIGIMSCSWHSGVKESLNKYLPLRHDLGSAEAFKDFFLSDIPRTEKDHFSIDITESVHTPDGKPIHVILPSGLQALRESEEITSMLSEPQLELSIGIAGYTKQKWDHITDTIKAYYEAYPSSSSHAKFKPSLLAQRKVFEEKGEYLFVFHLNALRPLDKRTRISSINYDEGVAMLKKAFDRNAFAGEKGTSQKTKATKKAKGTKTKEDVFYFQEGEDKDIYAGRIFQEVVLAVSYVTKIEQQCYVLSKREPIDGRWVFPYGIKSTDTSIKDTTTKGFRRQMSHFRIVKKDRWENELKNDIVRRGTRGVYNSKGEFQDKILRAIVEGYYSRGMPTDPNDTLVVRLTFSLDSTLWEHMDRMLKNLRMSDPKTILNKISEDPKDPLYFCEIPLGIVNDGIEQYGENFLVKLFVPSRPQASRDQRILNYIKERQLTPITLKDEKGQPKQYEVYVRSEDEPTIEITDYESQDFNKLYIFIKDRSMWAEEQIALNDSAWETNTMDSSGVWWYKYNKSVAEIVDTLLPKSTTYQIAGVGFDMIQPPSLDDVTTEIRNMEMCATECTQELFSQVMGYNPSFMTKDPKHPVTTLSWYDCVFFCNQLSTFLNYTPYYTIKDIDYFIRIGDTKSIENATVTIVGGDGFRLPTVGEWFAFAKAGRSNKWANPTMQQEIDDYVWYNENAGSTTHPVATKKPNEWGIYDMLGNAEEWCERGAESEAWAIYMGSYISSKKEQVFTFLDKEPSTIGPCGKQDAFRGFRFARTISPQKN